MLGRIHGRLTYANVVATLALFVALGGTGYAASQLTGRDIKNRSLSGVDLKKNSLAGTEINESKLKRVPSALNSITANSALAADVSKNSQTADSAAVAGIANDARALAGQGAATFERSSRTQFARAPANPAGTPGEQVLLSWPEMGVELTSASGGACGGSDDIRIGVRNTKASGPTAFVFEQGSATAIAAVVANGVNRPCAPTGTNGEIADSSGRTLFFECREVATELRCLGLRSEP